MEEINFLKFRLEDTLRLHNEVVERTWNNDETRKQYICLNPFQRIEVLPRGEVYTCCSAFVRHNYYIGNLYENSFEDIWNSESAKKLRDSVSVGNFEYCTYKCKWLYRKNNSFDEGLTDNPDPIRERISSNHFYATFEDCKVNQKPKYIMLTCDESCSLSCPSCRNSVKVLSSEASDLLYTKLMQTIRPLITDCELLGALASGDIFASKALLNFYRTFTHKEFPRLKLFIVTNGQLLTKKRWESLENSKGIPLRLSVSVDASNKETYEKLRRGGKWEILCENLNYLTEIKKSGLFNIELLSLNFVVQKENYLQMKDFVKVALNWNADAVQFQ